MDAPKIAPELEAFLEQHERRDGIVAPVSSQQTHRLSLPAVAPKESARLREIARNSSSSTNAAQVVAWLR